MEWSVAIIAAVVLLVATFSQRFTGTALTTAMAFTVAGVLLGAPIADAAGMDAEGEYVRLLAEVTLTLVLFADASRLDLAALRRSLLVPTRLLAIGLPLTILAGAVAGTLLLGNLGLAEALVLAVVLAPTDAALGQAVVSDPRVPLRIRQGLNVESGLNDGICVPLLLIALAVAEVEDEGFSVSSAARLVGEAIGYGALAGLVAGALIAAAVGRAAPRGLIAEAWRGLVPVAGAFLAYGMADAAGGSGFIAAFVAGVTFTAILGRDPGEWTAVTEDLGQLFGGLTFIVFGAVLLEPSLKVIRAEHVAYALLSLTLIRMIPVAIAMLGTHARPPTTLFLGWFGPRGLASIVFAVLVVQESELPHTEELLVVSYLTIALSVLLHGATAVALAARYGDWSAARRPAMEHVPVPMSRPRGPEAARAMGDA